MAKKRSYVEAAKYEDTPSQVKHREERNRARALFEREGKVKKGDGLDVDHIHPLSKGGHTVERNLRAIRVADNRSFHRGHDHSWIGPKDSLAAQHISGRKNKNG